MRLKQVELKGGICATKGEEAKTELIKVRATKVKVELMPEAQSCLIGAGFGPTE